MEFCQLFFPLFCSPHQHPFIPFLLPFIHSRSSARIDVDVDRIGARGKIQRGERRSAAQNGEIGAEKAAQKRKTGHQHKKTADGFCLPSAATEEEEEDGLLSGGRRAQTAEHRRRSLPIPFSFIFCTSFHENLPNVITSPILFIFQSSLVGFVSFAAG